ncbi:hypothetical protein EYF80_036620 [Liparis tanakae]|uniref:Uncharacterized protein n=1 Tax=Liparis tanakae TaxID=230148 RepID=A0A4Z2GIE7_9TELE|nr:hypothetical protein EYF80_036620 [Liparis tanakae]
MISEGQDAWEEAAAGGRGSEHGVFLTDSGGGGGGDEQTGGGEKKRANQKAGRPEGSGGRRVSPVESTLSRWEMEEAQACGRECPPPWWGLPSRPPSAGVMSCEVRGMGVSVMTGLGSGDLSMGFSSSLSWSLEFPLYLWEPFEDFEAARFLREGTPRERSGCRRGQIGGTRTGKVPPHFFWWEVVRRVHRKAPTTTTMMVKAPTEMMMTMTRM